MNIQSKNLNLDALVAADIAHHFHPFTNHKTFHANGGPRVITHGEGVWIWDAKGNKIFDGMSGLWCVNIGYGRKELAEVAYKQMLDLPFNPGPVVLVSCFPSDLRFQLVQGRYTAGRRLE